MSSALGMPRPRAEAEPRRDWGEPAQVGIRVQDAFHLQRPNLPSIPAASRSMSPLPTP